MRAANLANEFAHLLGMASPLWNGMGTAEFAFTSRGRLVFETADDDLLFFLIGNPISPHCPGTAERMLRLCREIHGLSVHAGLTLAGEPVFCIRLEPQKQSLPVLERGLAQLFALQDQLNAEETPIGSTQTP